MSDYRFYAPEECTGQGGYPPIWHERLKHEVRDAAGNRCVRCGHPYAKGAGRYSPCDLDCVHSGPVRWRRDGGDWMVDLDPEAEIGRLLHAYDGDLERVEFQAIARVLTVHHLDGVKGNCRWFNLVALCQRCHLTVQGRVRMERVYPWPHSAWFRPYVAGYYAWTYLGEDLDRQAVEARMDELLGLELAGEMPRVSA
jgi:hypothetical protein